MKEEKKKIQNNFIVAAGLLALFILYTVAIMFVDVQPIAHRVHLSGLRKSINIFIRCLV